MTSSLPRVLIIYTGGTFGMDVRPNADSDHNNGVYAIPHLSPQLLKKRLHQRVPEIRRIARCDVAIALNRDSAHIGPEEWLLIAKKIQENWADYDGIVLLHGTDTLPYTASALSFLLRPCLKPVVMTGAQKPLSSLRTDARTNLISAVEIAALGPRAIVNQVSVIFDNKLFQGNRVRKRSASDFAGFESPNHPHLAVVGTTIRYVNHSEMPYPKGPKLQAAFSKRVLAVHVTPGFPSEIVADSLPRLDALVLVVFQTGTAPTHDPSFLTFLKAVQKQKVPVTLVTEGVSQMPGTIRNPFSFDYAAGKNLLAAGCLPSGSLTPECAFVKTALVAAQTKNLREFEKLWKRNLAGEGI